MKRQPELNLKQRGGLSEKHGAGRGMGKHLQRAFPPEQETKPITTTRKYGMVENGERTSSRLSGNKLWMAVFWNGQGLIFYTL